MGRRSSEAVRLAPSPHDPGHLLRYGHPSHEAFAIIRQAIPSSSFSPDTGHSPDVGNCPGAGHGPGYGYSPGTGQSPDIRDRYRAQFMFWALSRYWAY